MCYMALDSMDRVIGGQRRVQTVVVYYLEGREIWGV